MVKLTLRTTAILLALGAPALADSLTWTITEEGATGIKSAQGKWLVTIDAEKKISGSSQLQKTNGDDLSYAIDGSVKDSVYTVNMSKRTDGKNGCVWTGQSPETKDAKSHGLIGKAACDGNVGFTIRAGF